MEISPTEPWLNIEVLRQTLPDKAKARKLLLRFKPVLRRELAIIEREIVNKEWGVVRTHAHRIRSGSLYLGIEGVGKLAAQLEELIDKDTTEDEMLAVWSNLRDASQQFIRQTDAELLAALENWPTDQ